MFHPETEDMLPRMAPKPSASIPMGASEATVRPQVPEVSILFGQQEGNSQQPNSHIQQQQNKNNTQQTYASWKKQMLPKVTYPAAALIQSTNGQDNSNNKNNVGEDYNIPRSNLYPLRSTITPSVMPVSTQSNGFTKINGGLSNPLTYNRNLENCSNNNNMFQPIQHQQFQQQTSRQVLPLTNLTTQTSVNPSRDILTICAGTQTETINGSCNNMQGLQDINLSNMASKKDLDDILQLVKDMRHEQLRIVQMLETILFSPKVPIKPDTRDMSVQVEIKENENLPTSKVGELQDNCQPPVVTNKFIQHLKPSTNILQTPKGKPMAQSTTYRPNSPQSQPIVEVPAASNYQKPPNLPTGLSKSSSDTSLAMNELALKYLPNDKLAELLNELNMASPLPPTTQDRLPERFNAANNLATPEKVNIENFERSSTDISNASYKYLKKYRLLPEDQGDVNDCENFVENHHAPQYYTPLRQQQQQPYDNAKNTPICHRKTPVTQGKCSPYAGRLPLSPLARAATPQNIVDLENIKYQPKFL